MDAVLQHAHSQRIVEFGTRGNGDNVRSLGLDHPVEIVVTSRNSQFVAEDRQQFGNEVAKCHNLGAGMLMVRAARGRAPASAAQNSDSVRFHGAISFSGYRTRE